MIRVQIQRRRQFQRWIFVLAVFFTMLVFFTLLHPIPIMDGDDVIYTVVSRKAIPRPGEWNPTRMMPELLMSFCGNLAGLAAAAGWGSFINCQVVVLGAMLSGFIAAYTAAFQRLLEKRFNTGRFTAVCLSLLFLLMHFLVFRTKEKGNLYMFYSYDACCVFYYTISALFCCTLVLYDMAEPRSVLFRKGTSPIRTGCLLLALYCAVFSNLHGSVILAAWYFLRLIREIIRQKKAENAGKPISEVSKTVLKENNAASLFLLFWLAALLLEATGGRAASTGGVTVLQGLEEAFTAFGGLFKKSSLFFLMMLGTAAVLAMFLLAVHPNQYYSRQFAEAVFETAIPAALSLLFILLLSAASEPSYAGRPQVVFPVFFSVFLLVSLVAAFCLRRVPAAACLLPLVLVFCLSMTNTRMLTFADSNPLFIDGHVAVAVENSIYGQIIDAAKAGETEITVLVPRSGETVSNWPHDGTIAAPMVEFFMKYGLIDHTIAVNIRPDSEVNRQFHIPDNPVLR